MELVLDILYRADLRLERRDLSTRSRFPVSVSTQGAAVSHTLWFHRGPWQVADVAAKGRMFVQLRTLSKDQGFVSVPNVSAYAFVRVHLT
jgi:hypothetical protein